jgi:4-diphosphocytidyl-2-C-methyl-D-erythritol kinase
MVSGQRVTVRACAKINLGLEVLGRRPDGYHDLVTVFQTVDLADELTVSFGGKGLRLVAAGLEVPDGRDNLCLRAAEIYFEAAGVEPAATVELVKRIPIGAGLGGGSSDAAATICALQGVIGADVNLQALAAEIGSDVAFFINGGTALGEGRGERLSTSARAASGNVVIAKPDLAISTAEAYGLLGPESYSPGAVTRRLFEHLQEGTRLLDSADMLVNVFQPIVETRYPEVGVLREDMLAAGAAVAMLSGSGSAVFGLFATADQARDCAEALRDKGYWIYVGEMIKYSSCASDDVHREQR